MSEELQRERAHWRACRASGCPRCSAYLAWAKKRDARRVNLIFSTLWVLAGAAFMLRVLVVVAQ